MYGIIHSIFISEPKSILTSKSSMFMINCTNSFSDHSIIVEYYPSLTNISERESIILYNQFNNQSINTLFIYYEVHDNKPNHISILIKNTTDKNAGIYKCTDKLKVEEFVIASVTVLLDEKPQLSNQSIKEDVYKLCCEIGYVGNIPPRLIIYQDSIYEPIELGIYTIHSDYVKYCVLVTKGLHLSSYWCEVTPNISVTNINNNTITWGNAKFAINSTVLLIDGDYGSGSGDGGYSYDNTNNEHNIDSNDDDIILTITTTISTTTTKIIPINSNIYTNLKSNATNIKINNEDKSKIIIPLIVFIILILIVILLIIYLIKQKKIENVTPVTQSELQVLNK